MLSGIAIDAKDSLRGGIAEIDLGAEGGFCGAIVAGDGRLVARLSSCTIAALTGSDFGKTGNEVAIGGATCFLATSKTGSIS